MQHLHRFQLDLVLSAHPAKMESVKEVDGIPIISVLSIGMETSAKVRHIWSVQASDFLDWDWFNSRYETMLIIWQCWLNRCFVFASLYLQNALMVFGGAAVRSHVPHTAFPALWTQELVVSVQKDTMELIVPIAQVIVSLAVAHSQMASALVTVLLVTMVTSVVRHVPTSVINKDVTSRVGHVSVVFRELMGVRVI